MKIIIHRGTHQIGGVATEISTANTRILIDMGDELSLDPNFVSAPLHIPGVTDVNGRCDAVLFTHYHGDHTGQMTRIRPDIPLYVGALAKDIMLMSEEHSYHKDQALCDRIKTIRTFESDEHTINVHINKMRDRFRDSPDFEIVTVRGLGYKAVKGC